MLCLLKNVLRKQRLFVIAIIASMLAITEFFTSSNALAAISSVPSPVPTQRVYFFEGRTYSKQMSTTEIAYITDKQNLFNTYSNVLQGKKSLNVFKEKYQAFMIKWRLGNMNNALRVFNLTQSNTIFMHLSNVQINPLCAQTADKLGSQSFTYCQPITEVQFPEEQFNYCGPATMATTLVEDSFFWPGTNSLNGYTITHLTNTISQPYSTALNDETYLAENYLGIPAGTPYGTDPGTLLTALNEFIQGKGGQYAPEWSNNNLQSNIVSDIATGWDVPLGIYVPANIKNSLPGYPKFSSTLQHWVAAAGDVNYGATIYYADPTYNSPLYTSANGWNTPGPYASTSITNLATYVPFYLW